jgi:hypothetical protein
MKFIFLIATALDNATGNFGVDKLWINECKTGHSQASRQVGKQASKQASKQTNKKNLGKDSYMIKPPYYESLYNKTST